MLKDKLVKLLATFFGFGYFPAAPGTAGSLPGLLFFWLIKDQSRFVYWAVTLSVAVLAIAVSQAAERVFAKKDAQIIVIDEVAGQLLTFFLIAEVNWVIVLLGFLAFRFFDVVKIFPANWAQDNLPGGWGVACDDLVAGLQAGVVIYLIQLYLLPHLSFLN